MCTSPNEYIYIHLSGSNQQTVTISLWNDSVAMCETNPQASMGDDFRERKIWCFNIKFTLDYLEVGGNTTEKVIRLLVCEIA